MSKNVSRYETFVQSTRAYKRWNHLWEDNCVKNHKAYMDLPTLKGRGYGKKLIICSFGPSLKKNIEDMKRLKMHYTHDVMCVDKATGTLLKNGIIPRYVILADAHVPVKYINFDKRFIPSMTLISCITANHEWVKAWKEAGGKVQFYYNKDGIETHAIYSKLMGYEYDPTEDIKEAILIPAASNVGNSACVLGVMVMNYDETVLIGYDYSYKMGSPYYGDDKIAGDTPRDTVLKVKKHSFNNHGSCLDINNEVVCFSNNMNFSCRWLKDFIITMMQHGKTVVNATGAGILDIPLLGSLN